MPINQFLFVGFSCWRVCVCMCLHVRAYVYPHNQWFTSTWILMTFCTSLSMFHETWIKENIYNILIWYMLCLCLHHKIRLNKSCETTMYADVACLFFIALILYTYKTVQHPTSRAKCKLTHKFHQPYSNACSCYTYFIQSWALLDFEWIYVSSFAAFTFVSHSRTAIRTNDCNHKAFYIFI